MITETNLLERANNMWGKSKNNSKIEKEAIRIIASLYEATTGKSVFLAFSDIPTDNLLEMQNMINHILELRKELVNH